MKVRIVSIVLIITSIGLIGAKSFSIKRDTIATHMDQDIFQEASDVPEDITEYNPAVDVDATEDDEDADLEGGESTPVRSTDSIEGEFQSPTETAQEEVGESTPVKETAVHEAGDELEVAATQVPEEIYQDDLGEENAVDLKQKRNTILQLMTEGEKFLQQHRAYDAFHAFTHNPDFFKGELYLFVLDTDGTFLAHGQQTELVWRNFLNVRDNFGTPFIKTMLKVAKKGGGWVTYQWRDATKISYVKEVNKDGKIFVLGCGYYPHSKADAVVSLVKGAVAMFKQAMKEGRPIEEVFSTFSYPLGRFVHGDLYLYALDFNGVHFAHGDRPGFIGTSAYDYRDAHGKYVNQEIIAKLKDGADGVWIEYFSKNADKRAYAEKVTDNNGKNYFISCGYYPKAGQDQLIDLVRRGYEYMKGQGVSIAANAFSDKRSNDFRYGDLFLIVYNLKGKCIAHGGNPDLVGQNFWDDQDQDGRYYVREIINKSEQLKLEAGGGEAPGGWVNYKLKNSFVSTYVKPIKIGLKDYVICSGLYPITKKETAILLAQSAASFLRTSTEKVALGEFTKTDGKFIQGDLDVFVYAFNGICLAYGDDFDYIWRNMLDVKDDKGLPYVQVIINTVRQGSGRVTYTINGAQRVVFIERVDKNGGSFAIGSGYFM
jgi:signal transduction histidine kinase